MQLFRFARFGTWTLLRGAVVAVSLSLIIACGGGGSSSPETDSNTDGGTTDGTDNTPGNNDDGTGNSGAPAPTEQAFVQQLLSLPISGYAAETPLSVRFNYVDASGNAITDAETVGLVVGDDALLVQIPYAFSPDDGSLVFGDAQIDIVGYEEPEPLAVEVVDLPELDVDSNGLIYAAMLQASVTTSQEQLALLSDVFEQGFLTDANYQIQTSQINQDIELMQATLDEYFSQGTISIYSISDADIAFAVDTLSPAEATRVDRVLLMTLASQSVLIDFLPTESFSSPSISPMASRSTLLRRSGYADVLTEEQRRFLKEKWDQLLSGEIADEILASQNGNANSPTRDSIRNIAEQIRTFPQSVLDGIDLGIDKAKIFLTGVGLSWTGSGLVVNTGAPLVDLNARLAALINQVSTLPITYTMNAITNDNTDAFLNRNGTEFDHGAEILSTLVRISSAVTGDLPEGVVSGIANLVGKVTEIKDTLIGAKTIMCATDNTNRSVLHFRMATNSDFCGLPDTGSTDTNPTGYVLDSIEIPEPFYRAGENSLITCETTVSEGQRIYRCIHTDDGASMLEFEMIHDFSLRSASGDPVFKPGEKIYLDVSASITGYSYCCYVGNSLSAAFASGTRFRIDSHTGDGAGTSLINGNLPPTGVGGAFATERQGSASLQAVLSSTVPALGDNPISIVLKGSNGDSVLTYHLIPN